MSQTARMTVGDTEVELPVVQGSEGERAVDIRHLREKIEKDPAAPAHLITVWGVGYKFEP